MGVGAGLYMYDVVIEKFTLAISSLDEFLLPLLLWENTFNVKYLENGERYACVAVIDKLFSSMV